MSSISARCLLAVLALAASGLAQQPPRAGTKPESKRAQPHSEADSNAALGARCWSTHIDLALEELRVGSGIRSPERWPNTPDVRVLVDRGLRVEDRWVMGADGAPVELERSYREVSARSSVCVAGPAESDRCRVLVGRSALLGRRVLFPLNADAGGAAARFPEGHGDPEGLLDGLRSDLELHELFASAARTTDSRWSANPEQLDPLLRPGGSLKLEFGDERDDFQRAGGLSFCADDLLRLSPDLCFGELQGTVDAQRVAPAEHISPARTRIELRFDLRSQCDPTEPLRGVLADRDARVRVESSSIELRWQGTGHVEWESASGRLRRATFDGDLSLDVDARQSREDWSGPQSEHWRLRGPCQVAFSAEPPPPTLERP